MSVDVVQLDRLTMDYPVDLVTFPVPGATVKGQPGQPRTVTADGFDESKHPRGFHGRWGHGIGLLLDTVEEATRRQDHLRYLAGQPHTVDRLSGGQMGETSLFDYPGGERLVSKIPEFGLFMSDDDEFYEGNDPARLHEISQKYDHQIDAEVLGSLVGAATRARTPIAVRGSDDSTGRSTVLVEHVDGKPASLDIDWDKIPEQDDGVRDLAARYPDDALKLALLDALIGNGDNHPGNLIVTPDGHLAGIDHAMGWFQFDHLPYGYSDPPRGGNEGFASLLVDNPDPEAPNRAWKDNDFTPADMAYVRDQLKAFEPSFDEFDRGDWYAAMMGRLNAISAHAKGTRNRIAP